MRNLTRGAAALGAAVTLSLSMVAIPTLAHADYAPSGTDVVGVGSDTVQDMMDFVADGDFLGDGGYNTSAAKNHVINFDATADANVRLAYGSGGASGTCTPGTGTGAGTLYNGTSTGTAPCVLNPSIVLRAGLSPTQRPNGSGAGINALIADTTAPYKINYVRRSSPASAQNILDAKNAFGGLGLDSVTIGTDPLTMLSTATSHAVALSKTQLTGIYSCTGGTGTGGRWRWTDVGGTSTNDIVPIIPQAGSGTRSTFLADISNPTLGSCVVTAEENDPYAPSAQGAAADDAIEPMSGGRLNLFEGQLGDNSANGIGGYFKDPSCVFGATATSCTSALTPAVHEWNSGTPSAGGAIYVDNRPLFVYFRDSDVNGVTAAFQPGGTNNWIRTLFYNPCSGTGHTTGCTTIGGIQYGPGGQPYVAKAAGQSLISAAGVLPAYTPNLGS